MKIANLTPLNSSNLFAQASFDIIDSATRGDEIIANYFVVRKDRSGLGFLQRLINAASRGAKITLIIDSYGSLFQSDNGTEYSSPPLTLGILKRLEELDISTYVYRHIQSTNFLDFRNITRWTNYSRRNHNKNLLFNFKSIDRKGLIIGDGQWADDHFTEKLKGNNVLIEGKRIFRQAFSYHKSLLKLKHLSKPHLISVPEKNLSATLTTLKNFTQSKWYRPLGVPQRNIQFVYNDIKFKNGLFRKTIQDHEISLMNLSSKQVIYSTPYFCPDEELRSCFIKNKSKVKIFTGKHDDNPYLPYGLEVASNHLIDHDIQMYGYSGDGNIHYKDLVCDRISLIKTSNGDGRSRFFNLETGVIISNRHYAFFTAKNILRDFNLAKLITKNSQISKDSFPKRLIKRLLTPFYYHHL